MQILPGPSQLQQPGLNNDFVEVTSSVTALLKTAYATMRDDIEASKSNIARAISLLQVETERKTGGDLCHTTAGGLSTWRIRRVMSLLEERLDEVVLVEDLSAAAKLSGAYFSRAFKQTFGASPHAFIIRRRLERACRLMLTTDAPLSEVALSCGFTDQAHLSKLFRRDIGESPAAWRRQRRSPPGTESWPSVGGRRAPWAARPSQPESGAYSS